MTLPKVGVQLVKQGIDPGEVFSKAPELGRKQEHCSATSTLSPSHAQSEEAKSLARRFPSGMGSVETFRLRVELFNL